MLQPVILVGRHSGDIPGVEVVRQQNVLFSLDRAECTRQLRALLTEAEAAEVGILFQNVPGIVAAALYRMTCSMSDEWIPLGKVPVGIIISKPGTREAAVSREYLLHAPDECAPYRPDHTLVEGVKFANARAKVEVVEGYDGKYWHDKVVVTVDPVAAWEFDHIEWL